MKAASALEKQIAKPLKKISDYNRDCPTCGAHYGLSYNRSGPDEGYCFYSGSCFQGGMQK